MLAFLITVGLGASMKGGFLTSCRLVRTHEEMTALTGKEVQP